MKGIIFDFNGTMFQDSHLHEAAWIRMIHRYSKKELSDEDIVKNIHGRTNSEILAYFISPTLTTDEIANLSYEKEAHYRSLCLEKPEELVLTDGLIATLDILNEQNIPITIATATVKENVEFYFEIFNLSNWFSFDKVVYDDGTFPGKPQPDIFIKAAQKLALEPKDCLVIEDAYSGLLAATRANIGMIIAIDPYGKNRQLFSAKELRKDSIIENFDNFYFNFLTPSI
ncbi:MULTISPECIES: HAD family hydrolase [Enterococcus]|uniref:Pesticidal protein Cry10Aa n=1 Tax=Candidatus Enterococcus mangumiae TaxID=2230878 RepID=A0ABZ2SZY8_9ENTE|nr:MULTISPECIES: HAD family phosphatase [unclassified Enterococcus]MBO0489855.1 HAD family phosphatase [Enterococcus sp. DIV1094]MBO1300867.1 HAD family phosphatase [Enterococcus sp. DIV1271a]